MRLFHLDGRTSTDVPHKKAIYSLAVVGSFLITLSVQAQQYQSGPTSLSAGSMSPLKVDKRTREVKRGRVRVKHTAQYEFYDRVEKAAKMKKRLLRKLAKPQYTNALYFGHRNPPRKRPPHKMRFCDECGIRH
jgi:hypothetical protein